MATQNPLEFEDFLRRRDIQISKVLTTPKGDHVRAILTASNTVILTGLGDFSGNTVVYTGEEQTTQLLGEIWDAVKGVSTDLLDRLTKGQNCTPVTTQVIEHDKDGKLKITTTTTMDCRPA